MQLIGGADATRFAQIDRGYNASRRTVLFVVDLPRTRRKVASPVKASPVAISVLSAFVCLGGRASAETLHIVNPLTLNTQLKSQLSDNQKKIVTAAFQHYQTVTASGPTAASAYVKTLSFQPLVVSNAEAANGITTVVDPVSHQSVNVNAAVAESVALQKAWFAATGRNLQPDEPIDLNVLSRSQGAVGVASAPQAAPTQIPLNLTGPSGNNCPAPTSPDDLQSAWDATKAFHTHPSDASICSLPYGGLIKQVDASHTPVNPTGGGFTRAFGNPKTAQGVFTFKPTISTSATDALDAALELSFAVSFLDGQVPNLTLLDGTASIAVPSDQSKPVMEKVNVGGVAFPDNGTFTAQQASNGGFHYTGSPAKAFTFFNYEHGYSVPYLLGTTTVKVHAWVDGDTSLTYDFEGGADGLFATATPGIQAGAHAAVVASVLEITGLAVTANVTVQNNKSSFVGLATLIPYDKSFYAVERIRAVYAPSDYQATVILTGYFPLGFSHFKVTVMDTGQKPLPIPSSSDDSNWSVQKISGAQ